MNRKFQEWSLKDVLSILFGEEAKYIAQAMRGKNLDGIPECIDKNKAIKDKIITGYTRVAEEHYGGIFGEEYFPSSVLDVSLDPLIVTCWLREEEIFEELFFSEPMPEGVEKIVTLKDFVSKEFDSIDLKEFSRTDYWSRKDFYVLLFGAAYSDIFFPQLLRQSFSNLDQEILRIEGFLNVAIKRKTLDDSSGEFEPIQLLAVLDAKDYPIPVGLLKSIEEGKFDEAGKLLGELRENMLYLLEHGTNPYQPPKKAQPDTSTVRGKTRLIKICIEETALRLLRANPECRLKDLANDKEIRGLIKSIDPDSVLVLETRIDWFREIAKKHGIKRKAGRPRKN